MRYWRNVCVHAASTTSLTVVPKIDLMWRMSSSDALPNAIDRCGVIAPDQRTFGAVNGMAGLGRSSADASRWRATMLPTDCTVRVSTFGHRARATGDALGSADHQLEVARDGLTLPRHLGRFGIGRVGREVEQVGHQVGAGHAVDGRVVHLGDEPDLAVIEAFDEVQLPQRAACGRVGGSRCRRRSQRLRASCPARAPRRGGCAIPGRSRDLRSTLDAPRLNGRARGGGGTARAGACGCGAPRPFRS